MKETFFRFPLPLPIFPFLFVVWLLLVSSSVLPAELLSPP